ncbi:hypothetical protein AN958_03039 [Leucoagaricus sp. SymC.cos]|nr:hypothetical protein AN958_03039 [Leucoagaricus sp. SymC.cos]
MGDKGQPTAAQSEVEGYIVDELETTIPSASVPAEGRARSTSTSPPPVAPTATKPSALAGQPISTSVPAEGRARSTSTSPPPVAPTATKPSALAGQPTTSSPSPAPEPRPTNTVTTTQNEPRDPQVASLKVIFPDFDDTILQTILESVDGDQDRAVDVLLGMSDPNFKSEAPPPVQQPQMTQEELDEQLARRLMLEEQEQAQQWRPQHRPHRRSPRTQGQQQQPQPHPQQTTSPAAGGRDTMVEFQEQLNKYAEIGKRNFGALVSKVRAKIQEFEKPDSGGSGPEAQPTWSNTGGPSYYDPNATSQSPPPRTNYQRYHGHNATGAQSPPPTTPTNTAISQPAAFYDPNPSPQPMSPPTQSSISVQGYEVEPIPSSTPGSNATSQTAQSTTAGNDFSATVPPRGPSPANPIDGGKLGLLPKRPISLIRDPPQAQPQAQRHNSDDNDLEYAENPFDEDRK